MSQVETVHREQVEPSTGSGSDLVLDVSSLNHWYEQGDTRRQVLFDIKLQITCGEIVIMLGPSGHGKTTLLTLFGALRKVQDRQWPGDPAPAQAPSLRVLGQELYKLNAPQLVEVRRRIGFIFQGHNLFRSLTAMQNVQLALELHETDARRRRERAAELLQTLNLAHRLTARPGKMSGGENQRVAIARALANRPRLILADEPTAALDEKAAELVVTELKKLARAKAPDERSTILVVTHDERILDVADRIVTIKHGRIETNWHKVDVDRIVAALKSSRVFSCLHTDILRRIASRMGLESFPPNTRIFEENQKGDRFYLIAQGSVEIIREGPGPFRRVLGPGEVFGELALRSEEGVRAASAVAREDLVVYSMNRPAFIAAVLEFPTFNEELRKLWLTYDQVS